MRPKVVLLAAGLIAIISIAIGQTPAPMLSVSPAPAPAPVPTPIPTKNLDAEVIAAIELVHALKAKNEETLKKQEATLQLLDQLQKEAEQLRIFTKRS